MKACARCLQKGSRLSCPRVSFFHALHDSIELLQSQLECKYLTVSRRLRFENLLSELSHCSVN